MRRIVLAALLVSLFAAGFIEGAVRRRAVRSPGPPPAPQGVNDTYESLRDTTFTAPAPGVLANDTRNAAVISSYGAVSGTEQTTIGSATATAQGGSLSISADGGLTYHPAIGFTGLDQLKYVLTNGGGSSTATVSITVFPPPPVATADNFTVTQNTPLNVSAPGVLSNDTLNGAAIASFGAATGTEQATAGASTPTAQNGTIRLNADGSFRYDAAAGFIGSDSFKYVIANAGGSANTTVTILVQTANTDPDFIVTSPGFFFSFSGVAGQNPVLTLTRGRTYRFQVNTSSIHPFEILDAPIGSVTNNDISSGILTFAVPAGPGNYRYHCSFHDFGNTINTVP